MIKTIEELGRRLNEECADKFANQYFGRFFTGDMTLKYDDEAFTLSLHRGKVIAVQAGVPNTGIDLGVAGAAADWAQFAERKSLTVSTNKMNPNNLTLLGAPLRTRQNFNPLAYLCRVFSEVLEEQGTAGKKVEA